MIFKKTTTAIFIFIFCLLSSFFAAADDDAILILDASGSMWGQIEGQPKIVIAREVLGGLLDELPETTRLGLMAYGHTRKGDCSDIEMLTDIGAARADIKTAVNGLNPKGKTPISGAVKKAAEILKYTESKATIILISDGIETCNVDPCALGKQLEQDGVDFTAHVVGFDITDKETQAQLQCLASSTGGRYLSADNAGELTIAIGETVRTKDPAALPAILTLQATELTGGLVIEAGLSWKVQQSGGGDIVLESNDAKPEGEVPPGVYDVFVERLEDGLTAELQLVEVLPGAGKVVTIVLNLQFEASVAPSETQIGAGKDFSVNWTGPDRKSDFVTIVKPDTPARSYNSYGYTQNGNPLKLTAPTKAGDYEVRYVLGHPYTVLARTAIKVTESATSIKGPKTAPAGSDISVEWQGPNTQSDFITITKPDAQARSYTNYFYTLNKTTPQNLKLPVEPGEYELRYIFVGASGDAGDGQNRVIARQLITIVPVSASLTGPQTATVGSEISIEWSGPDEASNFITVTVPDARERAYTDYAYTKNGSPSKIKMPVNPGDYELRFVQNNTKVIARQNITVNDITITLSAPGNAKAGESLSVGWTGPSSRGDWITVAKPDARDKKYNDYFYPHNGNPQKLDMPKTAGTYEIRYVLDGSRVVARHAITVTE